MKSVSYLATGLVAALTLSACQLTPQSEKSSFTIPTASSTYTFSTEYGEVSKGAINAAISDEVERHAGYSGMQDDGPGLTKGTRWLKGVYMVGGGYTRKLRYSAQAKDYDIGNFETFHAVPYTTSFDEQADILTVTLTGGGTVEVQKEGQLIIQPKLWASVERMSGDVQRILADVNPSIEKRRVVEFEETSDFDLSSTVAGIARFGRFRDRKDLADGSTRVVVEDNGITIRAVVTPVRGQALVEYTMSHDYTLYANGNARPTIEQSNALIEKAQEEFTYFIKG